MTVPMPPPAPEPEPAAPDGRSFEDMLADPHGQFDPRSELLASIAAYAAAPQASAGIQPPPAPAPEAATPPRQLAARMDGDAARYREQADRASQAGNTVALNYAAGRSDGLLAAASDVITVLAPAWDALAAERDAAHAAADAYARVTGTWSRSMYAALIDAWRKDSQAVSLMLSETLDDLGCFPQWDGAETGLQWLNRTREAPGDQ